MGIQSVENLTLTTETPDATVLLCPGQGAQHVGMGQAWANHYPAAAEVFEQANQLLGFDLRKLCFEGPEELLERTDMAQPAIYTTSVACSRALMKSGQLKLAGINAGLSLGEFTALHLAGALDFADGLQLVRLRGLAMQEAAEKSRKAPATTMDSPVSTMATPQQVAEGSPDLAGTMIALFGADEDQAEALCRQTLAEPAHTTQVLVPANFNCPGQVVLSGTIAACNRAAELAKESNIKATHLSVAGAFHSPLMRPAADQLKQALDEVTWHQPSATVLSNVTARPHESDIESIKQRLVEQLTNPVRWSQSMQWVIQHTSGRFVELAPGKVLSGLMRRIDRSIKVTNCAEPARSRHAGTI